MTPDWVLQQELADARNHRSERAAAWARHRQQVRDERVALAHRLNADRMRRLMAAVYPGSPIDPEEHAANVALAIHDLNTTAGRPHLARTGRPARRNSSEHAR